MSTNYQTMHVRKINSNVETERKNLAPNSKRKQWTNISINVLFSSLANAKCTKETINFELICCNCFRNLLTCCAQCTLNTYPQSAYTEINGNGLEFNEELFSFYFIRFQCQTLSWSIGVSCLQTILSNSIQRTLLIVQFSHIFPPFQFHTVGNTTKRLFFLLLYSLLIFGCKKTFSIPFFNSNAISWNLWVRNNLFGDGENEVDHSEA